MTLSDAWNAVVSPAQTLAFGPWSLELRGDEVADIAYKGTLLLRAIRVVVRDGEWGTPPAVVTSLAVRENGLNIEVSHRAGDVSFSWIGTLALADDQLTFAFEGTALTAFASNRIGITVLHPPTLAGQDVVVRNPSGISQTVHFSEEISPHQPAMNVAALHWTTGPVAAELEFEGDVFETEDQRNWTDASFKTYSTPLSLPFPVRRSAGEKVGQSVTLRASGGAAVAVLALPLSLGGPSDRVMPELTLGASTSPGLSPDLPDVGILVELDLADANWPAALSRAVGVADVRLIASEPAELDAALDALALTAVTRIAVFDRVTHLSEPVLWNALVEGTAARGIDAELIGGTRAHFTELNRADARVADLPGALTFSITPQMHSLDREQIVESIGVQRTVILNARRIGAGRPLHVGPVTLRARFNAVAAPPAPSAVATVEHGYGAELVPGSTDPRQESRALAAWLVASVDALTVEGVSSISYFEAWGPRGIGTRTGAFPVALAFGWLAELRGETLLEIVGTLPRDVAVIATRSATGQLTVIASNLGDEAREVSIRGDHPDGVIDLSLPAADTVRWVSGA